MLGLGALDQRELELGARVGAVLHRAQRVGDQVEQPDDGRRADAAGLLGEPVVLLGGHAQLLGHLAERLDDHQPAQMRLQIAEEAADVAAGLRQPGGGQQRRAGVAGVDRVHGAEEQVGVGRAEHREDVVERDRGAGVGDELLERPERVAERARSPSGRSARTPRRGSRSTPGRPRGAGRRRSGPASGARSRTGGSGRPPSAAPCSPPSWRARRSCAAAAPPAS